MRILIIGSEGFIGKSLKTVLNNYFECTCVDVDSSVSADNYFCVDVNNPNYLSIFSSTCFDVCINASGSANVSNSFDDPLLDCKLNFLNVQKILDAIRLSKANTRFINLSSAAVYGNPLQIPIEEGEKLRPVSPYGFHKMYAESLCRMYNSFYGITSYSLRLFSVYGVGQKKLLLWDLVKKFITQDEVVLYGTGNESRDYINIEDVARVILFFINAESIRSGEYNVANGKQIFIKDIANMVKKSLKSDKVIKYSHTSRRGDPLNWEANIDFIKSIGYKQSITIENGVKQYVDWAKNQI